MKREVECGREREKSEMEEERVKVHKRE